MNAIVCELCGGNKLIKKDGVFECLHCGTQYTLEEAKSLFIEVSGTVRIDRTEDFKNILQNADTAFAGENYDEAFALYSQALSIKADHSKAILYRAFSSVYRSEVGHINTTEVLSALRRVVPAFYGQCAEKGNLVRFFSKCSEFGFELAKLTRVTLDKYDSTYQRQREIIDRNGQAEALLTGNIIWGTAAMNNRASQKNALYDEIHAMLMDYISFIHEALAVFLDSRYDYFPAVYAFWESLEKILEESDPYVKDNEFFKERAIISDLKDRWFENVSDKAGCQREYGEIRKINALLKEKTSELSKLESKSFSSKRKSAVSKDIDILKRRKHDLEKYVTEIAGKA